MKQTIKNHRETPRERREGGEVKRFRLEYKWSALSCTSLGALLASINGSSLIVALPTLLRELHTGLFALVWVLLSYLLTQTIFTIVAGRKADMVGRKKLYVGGMLSIALALSIITSALPREQMFRIFSGTVGHGMSAASAAPFVSGFHEALLAGAAASLIGAVFSALRGKNPEAGGS